MFLPHNHQVPVRGRASPLADGQLWGALLAWHSRAGLPSSGCREQAAIPRCTHSFPMSLVGRLYLLHLLELPSTSTWLQFEDVVAICVGYSGHN